MEADSSEGVHNSSDIPVKAFGEETEEYNDLSDEDAESKMHHIMHSDTIIVVLSLVVMICLGLFLRSLFMKLASMNQRKERMRGGMKQLAEHMNYVTRSMSNDLELPNSPQAVIRTYSNFNRKGVGETSPSPPQRGAEHSNSLRVHAINNAMSKEEKEELEMQMSVAQSVSLEMDTLRRER